MVARIEPVPVLKYQVWCDEKHKHLGLFDTQHEASAAQQTHNETHHGCVAALTPTTKSVPIRTELVVPKPGDD